MRMPFGQGDLQAYSEGNSVEIDMSEILCMTCVAEHEGVRGRGGEVDLGRAKI